MEPAKTPVKNKYFGTLLSLILTPVVFILGANISIRFLYNGENSTFNIAILLAFCIGFLYLVGRIYPGKSKEILFAFIVSIFVVAHLVFSGLTELLATEKQLEENKYDFLLVLPVTYLVVFIWGIVFDVSKNKRARQA